MRKLLGSIALLLGALGFSPAGLAADMAIRIGYQPGTAPRFFVARDQQFFQKAGLAPDYVKFISGPPMLAALQSEDVDVAFMTTPPAIFALSQGIDVCVFFIESDRPGIPRPSGHGTGHAAECNASRIHQGRHCRCRASGWCA